MPKQREKKDNTLGLHDSAYIEEAFNGYIVTIQRNA